MNTSTPGWLALGSLLILSPAALAQAPEATLVREMALCRSLAAVPERVACYDRIALPGAAQAPRPAQPSQPAAAAVPTPALAPAPAPVAGFGLPAPPPVQASPQAIDSRIDGRFEGWSAGTRFKLANGQVWEVVDSGRVSYDLPSPTVRITRGLFGSFFMEVTGVSATPRVRRVQ